MREWPVVIHQDERVDDAGCVIGAVNLAVMLVEAALLLAIWVLIPSALIDDRLRPLAAGDRGEPVGRRQQPVPGVAAGGDDGLVVRPDAMVPAPRRLAPQLAGARLLPRDRHRHGPSADRPHRRSTASGATRLRARRRVSNSGCWYYASNC